VIKIFQNVLRVMNTEMNSLVSKMFTTLMTWIRGSTIMTYN